ncbi:hypothetical protein GIB67_032165 [Kingdonia uniflora]|uniref:DUF4283 domain-containing protein n=1 Tax=Kingdonia uniflora TaxID=39325 RepID=A0A7J7MX78_9MAGN|nr:hypothetical protein GIB67_032165 [Kingdonia uniflora]
MDMEAGAKIKHHAAIENHTVQAIKDNEVLGKSIPQNKIPATVGAIVHISYADKVWGPETKNTAAVGLIEAGRRGGTLIILIPREELSDCISTYKFSLIGRLDLLKIKFATVQEYANTHWKTKGPCKLIPIGKGFFIVKSESKEDKIYIWSRGPWMVEQMPMRLMPWNPFF